jgi:hypothetical protein
MRIAAIKTKFWEFCKMLIKKKSQVLNAHCWGDDWYDMKAWLDSVGTSHDTSFQHMAINGLQVLKIKVGENDSRVINRGDWIMRLPTGEFVVKTDAEIQRDYECC